MSLRLTEVVIAMRPLEDRPFAAGRIGDDQWRMDKMPDETLQISVNGRSFALRMEDLVVEAQEQSRRQRSPIIVGAPAAMKPEPDRDPLGALLDEGAPGPWQQATAKLHGTIIDGVCDATGEFLATSRDPLVAEVLARSVELARAIHSELNDETANAVARYVRGALMSDQEAALVGRVLLAASSGVR